MTFAAAEWAIMEMCFTTTSMASHLFASSTTIGSTNCVSRVSLAEIADAWRCYHERAMADEHLDDEDPDWWAVQFWLSHGLAFRREEIGREGLIALVDAVGDRLLSYVGAGPLENFIEPAEDRIRWLEEAARRSARFRHALASVWIWDFEAEWVCERLERAAGVRLARPDR